MKRATSMAVTIALTGAALAGAAGARGGDAEGAKATNGRIAFQAQFKGHPQIFTIKPNGTGLKRVTHVQPVGIGAENASWTPNGSTIAFDKRTRQGVDIFTVDAGGGDATRLGLGVGRFNGDPAYSPNGAHISFDQDIGPERPFKHGIFVAPANGGHAHRVTSYKSREGYDTESQWSPDSKKLAFTRSRGNTEAAIFTVHADGTHLKQLTPYKLGAASPDWSPDGSTLVFNTYWEGGKASNVAAIPASGGTLTYLTHYPLHGTHVGFRPSWSPDGTRIVFDRGVAKPHSFRLDLYTMDPDGSNLEQLTELAHSKNKYPLFPDWGTAP